MPNLLTNGGLETADGWTFTGSGQRVESEAAARTGSACGILSSLRLSIGAPITNSVAYIEASGLEPGREYRVEAWVDLDGEPDNDPTITLLVQNPALSGLETLASLQPVEQEGGYVCLCGTVTAAGTTLEVRIRTEKDGLGVWYFDDVGVIDVAIELAEKPIDALVTTLQGNLATMLSTIETEQGDGLTLTAPSSGNYHKRPKAELAGDTVHVEVFEDSFSLRTPYQDANHSRATFDCPINVRLTVFNRDNKSADENAKYMRRLAAAVVRVLLANPTLGGTEGVQVARVESVEPNWTELGEDSSLVKKFTTTIPVTVSCEEV